MRFNGILCRQGGPNLSVDTAAFNFETGFSRADGAGEQVPDIDYTIEVYVEYTK